MIKKKIFSFLLIAIGAISLSGCGLKDSGGEPYQVELEVWGLFDDSDAYAELFAEYRKLNPFVKSITYRKMAVETYKDDLLNALASGKGPDIFLIRNAWREGFEDKIAPAPSALMTERQYRDTFVDVVADDFIGKESKIFGVPLSVDSLALYYNKDIFNAAGVARPPVSWEELPGIAQRINRVDQFGNITQSAIALGTAYNINRSTDILTALMFQLGSGISHTSAGNRIEISDDASRNALDFYTQFARVGSNVYSWNPRQHYSIDAFYEGTLGMMVNYSWQYATIKQKNAKLNIGIAPLPQFATGQPINFANYWAYAVSKNKEYVVPQGETALVDKEKQNYLRVHESWQLLKFLSMPPENKSITLMNGISGNTKTFPLSIDPAKQYLLKTGKPAARRDLIESQKTDPVYGVFAAGNLVAKNWAQKNPEAVETVFAEMIDAVNRGEKNTYDALSTATNRINVLRR